jgi:ubiquinone/menaquinone biosynthesis C-methylase UbiE
MTTILNRFNRVSRYYDTLTSIVFLGRLHAAQRIYLKAIPQHATVLMMGGGTGWLLKELVDINPDCQIYYIDASSAMISLAKKKMDQKHSHRVVFIAGTEDSIPAGVTFDVVVTHFFLDLFSQETLRSVIQKISRSLQHNGLWIVSDFVNKAWWQAIMLAVMYTFFRITCGIEARVLPDWTNELKGAGLEESYDAHYFRSFIKSAVFIKRQ